MRSLLQLIGVVLARLPESALRLVTEALGQFGFLFAVSRRKLVLSNLSHAFPERSDEWRRQMARETFNRIMETALFSLASPFLSNRRIQEIIHFTPDTDTFFRSRIGVFRPTIMALPHLAGWEALTAMPLLLGTTPPEVGVIFRPLDNAVANAWVKKTRERFGLKLLSRKEGFVEAQKILRRGGSVALLFDQNAGMQGALTTLFGRVCSTTELPGLLAEKYNADVYAVYPHRRDFWRFDFTAEIIPSPKKAPDMTIALNRWLEGFLSHDDGNCASWLWLHDRWRHQDIPQKRLRLESKRDLLLLDCDVRSRPVLPKKTRIFVRLPNWLGDVCMTVPLLRAIRISRPDVELTLIGKSAFAPLIERFELAEHFISLPSKGLHYWKFFHRLQMAFPDTYILFTNSARGDIEAAFTRCPQRFGISRPKYTRPLLTHRWPLPASYDEAQNHQLKLWTEFLSAFGLTAPADLTPLISARRTASAPPRIGLIAGSENNPGKRWPIEGWRVLISSVQSAWPQSECVLFGTQTDGAITAQIADGFDGSRVTNLAGKTDLNEYISQLTTCAVLVANDTGGMHLANALGIPVVGLFGPTNPIRTGPVFNAPVEILQPLHCPPTGGGNLADLPADRVFSALRNLVEKHQLIA